jgi:integrase
MPEDRFTIGRYWIGRVADSGNWYRFWYDTGSGEVRRRSLGVTDFERAKLELAAIVLKEGSGRAAEPKDAPMIAVLTKYWEEHTDKKRNRSLARRAGRHVLDHLGNDARVGAFTRKRQIEMMQKLHASGMKPSYVSRIMSSLQAALNYAVALDDDDEGALLTRAPKIIYQPKAVADALNAAAPEPNNWHPDLDMIARFLDGLTSEEEVLRRWAILILGFCSRAEAALEAAPFQIDPRHRLIRLNPHGRRQNKKFRPTIPVADALWPLLEEWGKGETFTGHTGVNYPYKAWNAARDRLELPEAFTRRSLRHFMATELRHAHLRYGVPRVPADEREMLMGHRQATTNDAYGTFDPDYLSAAKVAVDAILRAIDARCKRPFLRQVTAKTARKTGAKTALKVLK